HDTTGVVNDVLEKSMKLMYKPTIEEVEIWRTKFFAYAHEVYRRVMRNELYYALHCLDNMRLSMVTAWYMDAGIQPNSFGDGAKLEGNRSKLSELQLLLLEKWDSSRDPTQITHVMQSMFPEIKRVHKSLCERLGIAENPERVDLVLRMVRRDIDESKALYDSRKQKNPFRRESKPLYDSREGEKSLEKGIKVVV